MCILYTYIIYIIYIYNIYYIYIYIYIYTYDYIRILVGLCEDRVPHDPMVNLVVIFSLRLAILGEKTPLTPFWCQPSTLS